MVKPTRHFRTGKCTDTETRGKLDEDSELMSVVVLRDPEERSGSFCRAFAFGATSASASTVKHILEWALEIAAGGQPLLPLGVIADFGHTAYGVDRDGRGPREFPIIHGLPPTLLRSYEDHVLGKVYADWSFKRTRRHAAVPGRDSAIGLAYLIRQFREPQRRRRRDVARKHPLALQSATRGTHSSRLGLAHGAWAVAAHRRAVRIAHRGDAGHGGDSSAGGRHRARAANGASRTWGSTSPSAGLADGRSI